MTRIPIREELRGLHPYGAPQLDVAVRLNTNENPFQPPRDFIEDLAATALEVAKTLNRYPDREASLLREDLAAYIVAEAETSGIDASMIWAANGSNEVMTQILQAFGGPGRKALTFAPTYSMYEEYARNTFTEFVSVPRSADFTLDAEATAGTVRLLAPDVVFLASPNNPTGTSMSLKVITAILDAFSGVVVVDEAYAEFRRPGVPSAVSLIAEHPRLLVTRTMSKAFGFAGARVGYVVAHPEVVDALRIVRLPYHLSSLTQAVARTALAHAGELREQVQQLRAERDALMDWLAENDFRTTPSDANFVMFGMFSNRHETWQALVDHGVLVREVGPEGYLRVSIGTPSEMEAFKEALKKVALR
jgi:histidinol-phosphate aminotransferase